MMAALPDWRLAEVLTALDAPGATPTILNLMVARRTVTVAGTEDGLRLMVGR
jgi:hypothetical protein